MKALFRFHGRLWVGVVLAALTYGFLPQSWPALSRVLLCWNVGVFCFLVLLFTWMHGQGANELHKKYADEDESAPFILLAVVIAALLSLVAIVTLLASLKQVSGTARAAHSALALFTLVQSWVVVPAMFTTHYADMFYSVSDKDRPLNFPSTKLPVFIDFAYFSFTIAAACQTADVSTNNGYIRRLVLLQTLVAFVFNAMILGFAINVTAGLLSGG
jgi:uncharacterized membrane protein